MHFDLPLPVKDLNSNTFNGENTIILAGMGRSGTTWAADIINYEKNYRIIFEPFFPSKVKEAKGFEYLQYLNPGCKDIALTHQAKTILSGELRNSWVDKDESALHLRQRIIKDIRCNLMLGWLKATFKRVQVVLVVRHPLQVVDSWRKLGWGGEYQGKSSDLEIILAQQSLIEDFPVIKYVMKEIDFGDFMERTLFQWCIFHLVPMNHLKKDQAHTVFYENLVLKPEEEVKRLFEHLKLPFHGEEIAGVLSNSSSTNFQHRVWPRDKKQLISGWRRGFTAIQIERVNSILKLFNLDRLYDKNGYPALKHAFQS